MFNKKKVKEEVKEPVMVDEPIKKEDFEPLPTAEKPKPIGEVEQQGDGEFTLSPEEMALAVNALASSQEFKLHQQVLIGQKISEIIQGYQESLKDGEQK